MTNSSALDPSPFFLEGGPVGALLLHGFTGAPPEHRLLAEYLHERGLTVSVPLLPGHGTTPEDLNQRKWPEWTEHAAGALAELRDRCQTVFIGGLSMGSLLALYLAATESEIAGAITYAPALEVDDWRARLLPLFKRFVPAAGKPAARHVDPLTESRIWCYDVYPTSAGHEVLELIKEVKSLLPRISCPLLIVLGNQDQSVRPEGARLLYDGVASGDKAMLALDDCGHVITADKGWESAAEETYRFIAAR
jgi:carboxylesterase